MSKLSREEIISICEERGYKLTNPEAYENLDTCNLIVECSKGHKIMTSLKIIRDFKGFVCPECEKQEVHYTRKPPEKSPKVHRIMAFDQATQSFGVSIYDDNKLVYYDVIRFVGATEDRLVDIATFVNKACQNWKPDFVWFEDIQLHSGAYGGYNTFKVLAELMGVIKIMLQINNVPHECVLNKVWQADFGIAGKDRATQKKNVIKKVKELFDITVNDDIADAILIGKYGTIQYKKSKQKVKMF